MLQKISFIDILDGLASQNPPYSDLRKLLLFATTLENELQMLNVLKDANAQKAALVNGRILTYLLSQCCVEPGVNIKLLLPMINYLLIYFNRHVYFDNFISDRKSSVLANFYFGNGCGDEISSLYFQKTITMVIAQRPQLYTLLQLQLSSSSDIKQSSALKYEDHHRKHISDAFTPCLILMNAFLGAKQYSECYRLLTNDKCKVTTLLKTLNEIAPSLPVHVRMCLHAFLSSYEFEQHKYIPAIAVPYMQPYVIDVQTVLMRNLKSRHLQGRTEFLVNVLTPPVHQGAALGSSPQSSSSSRTRVPGNIPRIIGNDDDQQADDILVSNTIADTVQSQTDITEHANNAKISRIRDCAGSILDKCFMYRALARETTGDTKQDHALRDKIISEFSALISSTEQSGAVPTTFSATSIRSYFSEYIFYYRVLFHKFFDDISSLLLFLNRNPEALDIYDRDITLQEHWVNKIIKDHEAADQFSYSIKWNEMTGQCWTARYLFGTLLCKSLEKLAVIQPVEKSSKVFARLIMVLSEIVKFLDEHIQYAQDCSAMHIELRDKLITYIIHPKFIVIVNNLSAPLILDTANHFLHRVVLQYIEAINIDACDEIKSSTKAISMELETGHFMQFTPGKNGTGSETNIGLQILYDIIYINHQWLKLTNPASKTQYLIEINSNKKLSLRPADLPQLVGVFPDQMLIDLTELTVYSILQSTDTKPAEPKLYARLIDTVQNLVMLLRLQIRDENLLSMFYLKFSLLFHSTLVKLDTGETQIDNVRIAMFQNLGLQAHYNYYEYSRFINEYLNMPISPSARRLLLTLQFMCHTPTSEKLKILTHTSHHRTPVESYATVTIIGTCIRMIGAREIQNANASADLSFPNIRGDYAALVSLARKNNLLRFLKFGETALNGENHKDIIYQLLKETPGLVSALESYEYYLENQNTVLQPEKSASRSAPEQQQQDRPGSVLEQIASEHPALRAFFELERTVMPSEHLCSHSKALFTDECPLQGLGNPFWYRTAIQLSEDLKQKAAGLTKSKSNANYDAEELSERSNEYNEWLSILARFVNAFANRKPDPKDLNTLQIRLANLLLDNVTGKEITIVLNNKVNDWCLIYLLTKKLELAIETQSTETKQLLALLLKVLKTDLKLKLLATAITSTRGVDPYLEGFARIALASLVLCTSQSRHTEVYFDANQYLTGLLQTTEAANKPSIKTLFGITTNYDPQIQCLRQNNELYEAIKKKILPGIQQPRNLTSTERQAMRSETQKLFENL